jgi:hypothetical protein
VTGLRLTRRRLLGSAAGVGAAVTGLWALPPRRVTATLSTPEWVLALRGRDVPDVPALADLSTDVRAPVRAAVEGGYESADPPDALKAFLDLDRETYVRVDGDYYRLDASLPVVEVWIEPVAASDAEDPVTLDEMERCMHPDPRGFRTPPLARADDPHRTYQLDPSVRSCIEKHPYLRFEDGDHFRYRTAVDDPGAPYTVTATRVSAATLANVEESVVDWADVPADAREVLAGATGRPVERESLPDSLRDVAAEYEFVRRENTFYEVDLDHPGEAPIRVDVRVTDAESREFDPARLELSVTNTGGRAVELLTGPPPPFGTLGGRRAGGDERLTLWTEEYVESRYVGTRAGRVTARLAVGLSVTLDPGETRRTRYQIRRDPGRLPAGTYRVDDGFGVRVGDGESVTFPFTLALDVE